MSVCVVRLVGSMRLADGECGRLIAIDLVLIKSS